EYDQFLSRLPDAGSSDLKAHGGVLEVSLHPAGAESLNRAHDRAAIRLWPEDVRHSVSDLAPVTAALLHPNDGWIEPALLLAALASALPGDAVIGGRATRLDSTQ